MTNTDKLFLTNAPATTDLFDMIATVDKSSENAYEEMLRNLKEVFAAVRVRYNFWQYGAKTGETYFEHATKGINYILSLRHFIFQAPPESDQHQLILFKMTILAYLIHDLNKQAWIKERKMKTNELWSAKTVQEEIEQLNALEKKSKVISLFFPEWKKYLNEITQMIVGHDENERMPVGDVLLFDFKLTEEELERGWNILKMVDTLDLLQSLKPRDVIEGVDASGKPQTIVINQAKKIEKINTLLSQITKRETLLFPVKNAVRWTKISNIMINAALSVLSQRHKIYPLTICHDGAFVFAFRNEITSFFESDERNLLNEEKVEEIKREIGKAFIQRMEKILDQPKCLYNIKSNGINFTHYTLQKPDVEQKVKKALAYMFKKLKPISLTSRESRLSKMEANFSEQALKSESLLPYLTDETKRAEFIENDDVWKLARLIEAIFYNVTTQICSVKAGERIEYMKDFLTALGIFDKVKDIYDQPRNASRLYFLYNYYFFPIIADILLEQGKDVEKINELSTEYLLSKMGENEETLEAFPEPVFLVDNVLQLFKTPVKPTALLQRSDGTNDLICSLCGKRLESTGSVEKDKELYKLWAEYTRSDVKAEAFSCMLGAGSGKPERLICPMCKWQVYLDYALSENTGGNDTFYSTFYLKNAQPSNIISSIQTELNALKDGVDEKGRTLTSFNIDFDTELYSSLTEEFGIDSVPIKQSSFYGFEAITNKEEIAGSIPLGYLIPTKSGKRKRNETEKYLEVVMNAFGMALVSNMKVAITRNQHDYTSSFGRTNIILSDMPLVIKKLCGGRERLDRESAFLVWKLLKISYDITKITSVKNDRKKGLGDRYNIQWQIIERLLIDPLTALHFLRKWSDTNQKKIKGVTNQPKKLLQLIKKFYEYKQKLKV